MAAPRELPRIRPDLVVQTLSARECVVKLRARREYFSVGPQEAFLLRAMQSVQTEETLQAAFEEEYGERLSPQDVRDFEALVQQRGLLVGQERGEGSGDEDDDEDLLDTGSQSWLYFRLQLFNPDAAFNRWEPRLRWIWTRGFLLVSAGLMLWALLILWSNRSELALSLPGALQWETVAIAWAMVIFTTALHEMAHGLTCKHYGGEVQDTGVLFMLFMPCLYANVSDAWLIPEKWKRLWITAAGGYCDLCIWALSVFCWRVTVPGTLVNYLAFVALTVCGARSLLNFNPLLRLDGYYLLSDWLSIPNLRKRSQESWMGHLRWLLWGAARPPGSLRSGLLIAYGAMNWGFAIMFLDLVFLRLLKHSGDKFGWSGIGFSILLLVLMLKRVFKGFFGSEFMTMIRERQGRTAKWLGGIAAATVLVFLIPVKHYATGNFEVRPGERNQVSAPVSAYVREVYVTDGETVSAGAPLVRLESSDLENQVAVKRSELRESEAVLAKLKAGPRPEEMREQRERVARLQEWAALGRREYERAEQRLEHELSGLEQQLAQTQAQLQLAQTSYQQSGQLYRLGALAGAELRSEYTRLAVLQSQYRQAESDRRAREAEGVRAAEAELARREQELADAQARLTLLEAGTRPEELAAEQARRDRLRQEVTFLEERLQRLIVRAPVAGVVVSHRIHEQVGTLAAQGAPLCTVQDTSESRIEISVAEEDIVNVAPGQPVHLKARAIPFETFHAKVAQIAPSTNTGAGASSQRGTLVVYCQLDNADGRLRTGMSGFGRVDRGWNSLGVVLVSKALRYLRTEFWW